MVDLEEQIIILYALYRCGGKGRKARIIYYITESRHDFRIVGRDLL